MALFKVGSDPFGFTGNVGGSLQGVSLIRSALDKPAGSLVLPGRCIQIFTCMYICIHVPPCIIHVYCVYVCIQIQREGERERENKNTNSNITLRAGVLRV